MMRMQDRDLKPMAAPALRKEVMRLRNAIRHHRDAERNDRCWILDLELYRILPESLNAGTVTMPEELFLKNCRAYYRRQPGGCGPAIPNTEKEGVA